MKCSTVTVLCTYLLLFVRTNFDVNVRNIDGAIVKQNKKQLLLNQHSNILWKTTVHDDK